MKTNFLYRIIVVLCVLSCTALACGMTAQLPTAEAVKPTAETEKLKVIFSEPTDHIVDANKMIVCGTVEGLNVRVEAGTQHQAIGLLADGTVVALTGRTFVPQVWKWYELSAPVAGWVSSRYLCEVEQ